MTYKTRYALPDLRVAASDHIGLRFQAPTNKGESVE